MGQMAKIVSNHFKTILLRHKEKKKERKKEY